MCGLSSLAVPHFPSPKGEGGRGGEGGGGFNTHYLNCFSKSPPMHGLGDLH